MTRKFANSTISISNPQNLRNDTSGHQRHFGPDEANSRSASAALVGQPAAIFYLEYIDHTNGASLRSANNAGRQASGRDVSIARNTTSGKNRGAHCTLRLCCRATRWRSDGVAQTARSPRRLSRHHDRWDRAFYARNAGYRQHSALRGSLGAGGQSLDGVGRRLECAFAEG